MARVEFIRTLRELGLGLDDVRRVLERRATVAEVAAAHVAAIDTQIRALKVSRAVLSTVSKRRSTPEETALVNNVAQARGKGINPDDPSAAELISTMFGNADLSAVLVSLEAGIDAGAERYRGLVSRVQGRNGAPDATEELRWLATALRIATEGEAARQ